MNVKMIKLYNSSDIRSICIVWHRAILDILAIFSVIVFGFFFNLCMSAAQVDIHISGPQAGIPIAIPKFCNVQGGSPYDLQIADLIAKDLDLSGMFKVIPRDAYIESSGKCVEPDNVSFSDWTPLGTEGLVRGSIKSTSSDSYSVELYLFDVLRQKMIVGKRYTASSGDVRRVAHKFANEIMLFFTGESGVFGTKIAYTSKVGRFRELFVMNLDGSEAKKLTDDKGLVVSPRWSPRGDKIAYTSYRTRSPDIYTMMADGGNPQQITNSQSLELGAIFSPDNSYFLASSSVSGISNLVAFDLRGRLMRQVTYGASIDVTPSFSPNGDRIVFCSNRGGGPQIYVMTTENKDSARRISFADSTYCTSPSWSPKGDKIAFVCRKGGNQLFLSDPDASNPTQLTYNGNNEDPSFSPDGRYLAFSTTTFGGINLAIVSLANGKIKAITNGRAELGQPAWSPRLD